MRGGVDVEGRVVDAVVDGGCSRKGCCGCSGLVGISFGILGFGKRIRGRNRKEGIGLLRLK